MLMEVMVALAILSGAVVVIIQSVSHSVAASEAATSVTVASFLLEQKLNEGLIGWLAGEESDEAFLEESTFDEPYERFEWSVDAVPVWSEDLRQHYYEEEDALTGPSSGPAAGAGEMGDEDLMLMTVTVSWREGTRRKSVSATAMRLRGGEEGP